jgi:hypothetical protein
VLAQVAVVALESFGEHLHRAVLGNFVSAKNFSGGEGNFAVRVLEVRSHDGLDYIGVAEAVPFAAESPNRAAAQCGWRAIGQGCKDGRQTNVSHVADDLHCEFRRGAGELLGQKRERGFGVRPECGEPRDCCLLHQFPVAEHKISGGTAEFSRKPGGLVGEACSPGALLILIPLHIEGQAVGANGADRFLRVALRNIGLVGISAIEQHSPLSEGTPFVLRFAFAPKRQKQNEGKSAADENRELFPPASFVSLFNH